MNESASLVSDPEMGQSIPEWIEELRRYVPDGRTVMASFKRDPEGLYQVNFRARLQKKSMVAIARAPALQTAVQQAATVLKKQILRERIRKPPRQQPAA